MSVKKIDKAKYVEKATKTPRVIAPPINPTASSTDDNGGISTSVMEPLTLLVIMEDDEFAAALFKIPIIIRPGIKNRINSEPSAPTRPGNATTNTVINKTLDTMGASKVCGIIRMNRETSFLYNVQSPSPLI